MFAFLRSRRQCQDANASASVLGKSKFMVLQPWQTRFLTQFHFRRLSLSRLMRLLARPSWRSAAKKGWRVDGAGVALGFHPMRSSQVLVGRNWDSSGPSMPALLSYHGGFLWRPFVVPSASSSARTHPNCTPKGVASESVCLKGPVGCKCEVRLLHKRWNFSTQLVQHKTCK